MKNLISTAILLTSIGLSDSACIKSAIAQSEKRTPVIVELFTSEGCNTCPPADKYLQNLVKEQPIDGAEIIALQEHVDYWNRYGWTDPFSLSQFSKRQGYYATFFKLSEIFTPQLIADGTYQLTSKTGNMPLADAARNIKGSVDLKIEKEIEGTLSVKVKVTGLPKISDTDKAVLLLAITENNLKSNVTAGENKGNVFTHMAVTRYLKAIGEVKGEETTLSADVKLRKDWKRDDLSVVAFVQEESSRRILAAIKIGLKK